MKIQNFFDKGYYLNLDRRTDRKEIFEKQMTQYGLVDFLQRWSAEDRLLRPEIEYVQHFCSYSFYKIFKDAYEKKYNRIVVFEDDFTFYDEEERGIDNIENALDQLSIIDDWDIIYFGGYVFDKEVNKVSKNLLKVNTVLTLHGFGVTYKCLEKFMSYEPFVDSAFDGWIGQRHWINKYMVYPMSSYQKSDSSDLDQWGKTPDITHWKQHYLLNAKIIDK